MVGIEKRKTVNSGAHDNRGNARLNLLLPEDCTKLNHYRQTLHNTEFLVTYTGNYTGTPNLGSTRNVPQTATNNYESTQPETNIHRSMESIYQTDEYETSSTLSKHGRDSFISRMNPQQAEEYPSNVLKILTGIHGSRESVYQTDEYEASSTLSETEPTVKPKSLVEKIKGIFRYIKLLFTVYVDPEISIEFNTNSTGSISYSRSADNRGNARLNLLLPEGFTKLNHYRQMLHNTEFLVTYTGNYTGTPNLSSTRNVPQTATNNYESTQPETSIHRSRERDYQTDEYEASSTLLENVVDSFLGRKNGRNESKRRLYKRTAITSLKLNETKRLEVLLHTAKYQIEGCPYSKDTCQLFINDSVMFSGAAFRHFLKNDANILGRWSLLSLSKSEKHLHIKIIDNLPLTLLDQIAEPLQNHKDGKQRKRPEDMLTCKEIDEYRAKHQESELRRKSPTNSAKGDLNIDDDVETDDKLPQNLDSYISGQITHDTDVETDNNVPLNLNYNRPEGGVTHDPLQTVSSKKEHNHPFWTTGIKTKQSKVKKRSRPPKFKICLQSRDDEVRHLVNDYFGDDIIRQCVHDFFESDVDRIRTQRGVFERPHIQWPSMYPRLPYRLRYLDEHVEDSEIGNQDQQRNVSATAAGE